MKTSNAFAKWSSIVSVIVIGGLGCISASAQTQTNKWRVGVYDSRAVAVAWGNSTEFREFVKSMEADHKKAKEAGDGKRVKEIESQMQLRQRRAHEQAFSTGSVAPVMARVKDSLPDIAKQAGVQIIVSKWELNHHSSDVEIVDVTDKIVALWHVNERGLKWCKEIQQKPPVPIDQLADSMD
ncbi:MAG: hypothetical protein QM813_27240 [Verrucomicrobiota bacterium]